MTDQVRPEKLNEAAQAWHLDAAEDEAVFMDRWVKHVQKHGTEGDIKRSSAKALKHLGSKHNQTTHGRRYGSGAKTTTGKGIPDVTEDFEARLYKERNDRLSRMGLHDDIKQANPKLSGVDVEMYVDVMTSSKDNFHHYGERLGLDNLEERWTDYTSGQHNIATDIQQKRAEYRTRQTLSTWDAENYNQALARSNDVDAMPNRFSTLNEARAYLGEKHGISVFYPDDADKAWVTANLNRMANTLDTYPMAAEHFRAGGGRLEFTQQRSGETYSARWNARKMEIPHKPESWRRDRALGSHTLVHEIGHAADRYTSIEGVLNNFDKGRRVSSYAWRNAFEDWAETYAAMVFSGGGAGLRNWFPEKFDYMVETVPGFKEFIQEAAG